MPITDNPSIADLLYSIGLYNLAHRFQQNPTRAAPAVYEAIYEIDPALAAIFARILPVGYEPSIPTAKMVVYKHRHTLPTSARNVT